MTTRLPLYLALLTCVACSSSGGDLVDSLSTPPAQPRVSVANRSLAYHGSGLVINATVNAARGIETVWAVAVDADGNSLNFAMEQRDDGSWQAIADLNSNTSASVANWTLTVTARDNIGNVVASQEQTITVSPARQAPAPPELAD